MWQRICGLSVALSFISSMAFAATGQYTSMHVAGTNNNWSVTATPMRLVDNNLWFVSAELDGADRFKFVPYNWTLSYGDNDSNGTADSNGAGDIPIAGGQGWYHISFDDRLKTYQVEKATFGSNHPSMSVVGTINAWQLNDITMELIDNHIWHVNIDLPQNTRIKFVPKSWALSFGDANADGTADTLGDGDIQVPFSGNVDIYFNDQNLQYRFENSVVNLPPIAIAGMDLTVLEGERIVLDGSGSTDPEGGELTYEWSNGAKSVTTEFIATQVGEFTYTLEVSDDKGASASDSINVTVESSGISGNYPAMHLVGTFNNWNLANHPMTLVRQNTWQIKLNLSATDKLKFVPASWLLSFGDRDGNGVADSQGGGDIAVNQGTSEYTITFNDETLVYTQEVEVIEPVDTVINIAQHRLTVNEGESVQLTVTDENGIDISSSSGIQWRSLNPDWVSVSASGVLTVNTARWGYAFVEASAGQAIATAKIFLAESDELTCLPNSREVTVHYKRPGNDYDGWGLHVWGEGWDDSTLTTWQNPVPFSGQDAFGVKVTLPIADASQPLSIIVHQGNLKDPAIDVTVPCNVANVYLQAGDLTVYTTQPAPGPSDRSAKWVSTNRIEWPQGGTNPVLHYSASAALSQTSSGVTGGASVVLTGSNGFYNVNSGDIAEILRSQIWIRSASNLVTGVQLQGVLDDMYASDSTLGIRRNGDVPVLSVWAPTAREVNLRLFDDSLSSSTQLIPMVFDATKGTWSVQGQQDWWGKYYLYDVTVYHPLSDRIERSQVTDPYSVALSINSQRSQIADLTSPESKPTGWDDIVKQPLSAPEDAAIYELHVRDFSSMAKSNDLQDTLRGKYLAFTDADYSGSQHLQDLADAGMTHVHLMPVFDIATINEQADTRDDDKLENLGIYGPTNENQQELVGQYRTNDVFNWGYDPFHYGVPEGSYAVNADGISRIVEFREMILSLHNMGYRVVTDVVYNHTAASGLWFTSVLDRIVPGYYHRLNADGSIQRSTCCEDTASEYKMMEKLMADTLVHWAKAFKIDAFRFDLMGHHLKSNITGTVRSALNALTVANDGVNGNGIYIYGEGWDFGGIADLENMDQINAGGTGVGTYNDRIRDAITGGPFEDTLQVGGVLHGNYGGNNISGIDRVRIGLAGNLRDYWSSDGGSNPVGYTQDPQENIPYVSKHDNYTLWDMNVTKAPSLSMQQRVDLQGLAMAYVVLAQGIPFIHAGVDLLRSKSGDRDSYDSGDWFNGLDFTGTQHNWGKGLPPTWSNNESARQSIWRPLLANDQYRPQATDISRAKAMLKALLTIRADVKLLRLESGNQIRQQLSFENGDRENHPGVIAIRVTDNGLGIDSKYAEVLTVFNSEASTYSGNMGFLQGRNVALHPALEQISSNASVNGATISVPPRSVAVFIVRD